MKQVYDLYSFATADEGLKYVLGEVAGSVLRSTGKFLILLAHN